MSGIRARLEKIERETAPRETVEIIMTGGLPGTDPFAQASFGHGLVKRDPDETVDAFRWRIRAAAKKAGATAIAFGGLPGLEPAAER